MQLVRTPTPCKPEAVPGLDWPGWASACQRVDICGNVPTLRLRQAVKLARAADEAHLRGMGVDWPVVHSRLASICSGFMSMSQLPSTVRLAGGWARWRCIWGQSIIGAPESTDACAYACV